MLAMENDHALLSKTGGLGETMRWVKASRRATREIWPSIATTASISGHGATMRAIAAVHSECRLAPEMRASLERISMAIKVVRETVDSGQRDPLTFPSLFDPASDE